MRLFSGIDTCMRNPGDGTACIRGETRLYDDSGGSPVLLGSKSLDMCKAGAFKGCRSHKRDLGLVPPGTSLDGLMYVFNGEVELRSGVRARGYRLTPEEPC